MTIDTADGSNGKAFSGILEVSNFLNQFQKHFLPELLVLQGNNNKVRRPADNDDFERCNKYPLGVISPRDLENVLKFRTLLEKFRTLEDELYVADQYGDDERIATLTHRYTVNKREEFENLNKQMQSISGRTKLLLTLLHRFEVWISKVVAQDQLVTSKESLSEAARLKIDQRFSSPFINLPLSNYFQEILPPIELGQEEERSNNSSTLSNSLSKSVFYKQNRCIECCTLPLPPNKNTWEAYAKLSIMVSILSESDFLERDSAGDEDGSGDIVTTVSSFKHNKNELLLRSLKSPACIYEFNRFKKGQNPSQRSDYTFSLSDVIPIWIRAQRNTQALRQLFLLFEVQLQPPTNKINGRSDPNNNRSEKSTASTSSVSTSILGTGMRGVGKRLILNMTETDDNDNDTQEHPHKERIQGIITNTTEEHNDLQYNAKFRGNPSSIRSQMTDISNYVDRLVEWAVINQSIFTYRRIKKQIWTAPLLNPKENQISNGQRRRRDSIRANPAKRMRIDEIDDENHNLFELRQACESFILRLFARRNRNALTILFSSRNEDSLDIGCLMNKKVLKQAAVLKQSNVDINMKEYMQTLSNTKRFHFEDRTFARIDRRLFIKGRYYGSSAAVSCRSNLSVLLESLSNVLPENQGSHKKLVASAKEDLEKLFGAFLMTTDDNESDNNSNADSNENGSAIYETALKLIAPPKGFTQQYLTAVLKSSPAPWVEKCWKCNAAGPKLHTCLNCEHVFHQECSSSGSATGRHIGLKTLIQSFSPLNDLVKKREPKNLEPPNFSTSSQWIEKTMNISRQIESDGFMSRLGITFESSDDCSTYFDALQSKNVFDIARKMNEDENNSSGRKCRTPLRIRYAGCLLTSVKQGYCAEQAGLQKGDIITGLEFGKCVDDNDEIMHGKSGKFDLSNGTHETFVTLFKVKSPVMMVTVRRPPINIVEMAKNWYTVITKLNRVSLDVLRGLNDSSFWYCGTCTQSQVCNASKGVFLEAECCRAVIRRIGMESYSQPFLEGNQKDESGFFCLRRLDSIMTHIMRIQSKDDSYESFPEAFLTPPIGNSIRHRLGWAKKELEKRPMELLCNAMKTFMTSSFSGVSQFATKRNAFIRHFLVTFSSWCVGSIKREMAGPPDVFRYAQPPWIGASCSVCCSRPVINHDVFTCANQLCVNHSTRSERHIDDINNKEITKVGNSMSDYSKRAALVGTSFLVLPVDPLVQYVSKVVRIEHENRPVEFIVASYLPPDYYDIVVNGRQKTSCDQFEKGDGIYHLLPVVNARQQLFLLERCKIRDKRENDKESNLLWASLDVLNLDGVARYSPTALQKKIDVSNAIRFAIDRVIIQHRDVCKSLTDSFDSSLHSQTANESRLNMLQYFSAQKSRDCNLDIQNSLISTLLKGKATTKLVRLLFHSNSTDEEISSVEAEAEADIDSSSWKIIQSENAPCELKFGLSSAQKGLIPINGTSPSSQILLPSSVLEGESILYYSDFLYENETVKKNIANSLLPPKLLPYEGKPDNKYFEMRFNLAKLDSSGTNNIFGWGFEILKWKNDQRILQVGRMKRGSPAHNIGLRPYDIISSINGRKFTKFYKISDFVTSIMGVPNVKVRMDEKQDRVEKILMLLSTIKDSNIKSSPVEICVYRVSSVHNHDNQCQAAVSRLQTSVQSTIRQQGLPHTNLKRSYDTGRSRSLITESQRGATINVQTKIPVIRNPLPTLDINTRVNPCAHVNPSYAHSNANSSVNSNANANANANANLNQANFVHRNSTTNTTINHRASAREKSRKEATMKLVQLLKNSYHERRPFQQSDLYRAARNGLVLTIMEVSLFLESLLTGAWKLGMRLLMPRYDVHIIVEQVKKIVMFTREMVLAVPIIGKNNYQHLLQLDFDRMNDRNDPETGDFILKEVTNGVEYKYRLPVKPLPIDRNIEIQYQHQVTHQHSIHHQHQHPTAQQYQQRQYQYPASHHQQRWQSHRNEHHARNSEWSNIDHRRQNDNANQMQTTVIDLLGSEDRNLSALDELGGKIDEPSLTMYNEGVCNSRGVHTNSGSSNRQAVSRVAPYPSERIRGGGGEPEDTAIDQGTDICLNEIPVQDWNQKPVYTLVQTLSEGSLCSEAGEDILVGFARKSSDGVISNKVKVEGRSFLEKIRKTRP
jgi:C-terminal processing protease CtpA/Prc